MNLALCIYVCLYKYKCIYWNAYSLIYSEKYDWKGSLDPTSVFSPVEEDVCGASLFECWQSLECKKANSGSFQQCASHKGWGRHSHTPFAQAALIFKPSY